MRAMRHKVEEARSNLEATKHRGDVLDGLMVMKKNGKIPGIMGRLVSIKHTFPNICITTFELTLQCVVCGGLE